MPSAPHEGHRRSLRLRGYDYSRAGAYFITICTRSRSLFFDDMTLKRHAEECWLAIPQHADNVELDEWVVMPNHLHGIIVILEAREGGGVQLNAPTTNVPRTDPARRNAPMADAPPNTVGPFSVMSPRRGSLAVTMRTYKAAVTCACREIGRHEFAWQRNYYEHIIRNEKELNAIREYICNNPLKWPRDIDNPANISRHTRPLPVDDYLQEAGVKP